MPLLSMGILSRARSLFTPGKKDTPVQKKKVHGRGTIIGPTYGVVDIDEQNTKLRGSERYLTLREIAVNNPSAAASIRHFYAVAGEPDMHLEPANDSPNAKRYAEEIELQLERMETPFRRIIQRQIGYIFYGFAIQEWEMDERDGLWVVKNIHFRPQDSIEEWIVDDAGKLRGLVQRNRLSGQYAELPRGKLIYTVDDLLTDLPNGTGMLRHIVELDDIRRQYVKLEAEGYEMDMQGLPVGKGPIRRFLSMVEANELTREDMDTMLKPLQAMLKARQEGRRLTGLQIDSEPHVFMSSDGTPVVSNVPTFDIELLKADVKTMADLKAAIARIDFEISRIVGTQMLMLGEARGTQALSEDISKNLALRVDGTLSSVGEAIRRDLFMQICLANGWEPDDAPYLKFDSTQYRDIKEITEALRNIAELTQVLLGPDDPALVELFDMLGLTRPTFEHVMTARDLGVNDKGTKATDEVQADEISVTPENRGTSQGKGTDEDLVKE